MATRLPFFSILFIIAALLQCSVRSDDTSDKLLQGINSYRASQNLSSLTENQNAACLAEQIAKQFKDQACSNTTGANTVPGTEQQFPNFPDFLNHCNLNASVTRDGAIMPACVPDLDPNLLLSNFTKSQYTGYLNDTQYTGIGLADEGNWAVVVLSTNTPTGNYATYNGKGSSPNVALPSSLLLLMLSFLMIWLS
ncbi:hypothetical protein J5N97_015172 [Dioscorea zingiberensis]|uniref:Uncharacterized GPI-anchored protein At5g19230-like domain-containing protein n=1 Tax=Dioscorea zingiberensis TaxID=325984 RepID=A0A9D5HKF8_9LILI|nr:hypothetical protein J5N97_015172 [Dioscorea zingiberensis]